MAKLHEILAAEKTPTAAWNQLEQDTLKKFKNPDGFFFGHSKSLKMLIDSPENGAIEDAARENKEVVTTVKATLSFALGIYAGLEDLLYQKNATNSKAKGTVMWKGQPLLFDLPVDELLGLESRLGRIRQLMADMPTLDATKQWVTQAQLGEGIFELVHPEEATKTEKVMTPVVMAPATDKHPAQVQAVTKDIVVGKTTLVRRTGAATAVQKAAAIKRVDDLIVEIKQARMRANETEVVKDKIADKLVALLMEPLN